MRLHTWNIRQGGKRNARHILSAIEAHAPDLVVLTEFRQSSRPVIGDPLVKMGWPYIVDSSPQGNDNGILVASKRPFSLIDSRSAWAHRWLALDFLEVEILAIHIPGSDDRWNGQPYKKPFWEEVIRYAQQPGDRARLIVGDFNTGLAIDAEGTPFKYPEYIEKLSALGWHDAWRTLHPQAREFTWYSNAGNGFRLDYAFLCPTMRARLKSARHSHEEREDRSSDHSSLLVELDLPWLERPSLASAVVHADDGQIELRDFTDADRAWVRERSAEIFGADIVVSRGHAHTPAKLPGVIARRGSENVGLATYEVSGDACELVTIDALEQWQGIGSALLAAVEARARTAGCRRIWLITTNDNVDALRFYQRRGYQMRALYPDALRRSRELKPSIPLIGQHGIPLRDELELEKALTAG